MSTKQERIEIFNKQLSEDIEPSWKKPFELDGEIHNEYNSLFDDLEYSTNFHEEIFLRIQRQTDLIKIDTYKIENLECYSPTLLFRVNVDSSLKIYVIFYENKEEFIPAIDKIINNYWTLELKRIAKDRADLPGLFGGFSVNQYRLFFKTISLLSDYNPKQIALKIAQKGFYPEDETKGLYKCGVNRHEDYLYLKVRVKDCLYEEDEKFIWLNFHLIHEFEYTSCKYKGIKSDMYNLDSFRECYPDYIILEGDGFFFAYLNTNQLNK